MLWACAKMLFYYYIYLILHVDSFFWKMSGVSAFQWFQETVHYLSHFTALHCQAWLSPSQNLNRSAFRLFGICGFFLRYYCGNVFFWVVSIVLVRGFRLLTSNLRPWKNTLDIQVFFETKSFRTLRCLMSRCIGFREKAGQHREPLVFFGFSGFGISRYIRLADWLIIQPLSPPLRWGRPCRDSAGSSLVQLQMSPKVRDTVQSRFEEKPRKDMYCLVVLRHPSEKYEFVSWDDDIPNIWENNKCSKPPTRNSRLNGPKSMQLNLQININQLCSTDLEIHTVKPEPLCKNNPK